jgi:hypothetical protein
MPWQDTAISLQDTTISVGLVVRFQKSMQPLSSDLEMGEVLVRGRRLHEVAERKTTKSYFGVQRWHSDLARVNKFWPAFFERMPNAVNSGHTVQRRDIASTGPRQDRPCATAGVGIANNVAARALLEWSVGTEPAGNSVCAGLTGWLPTAWRRPHNDDIKAPCSGGR